MPFSSRLTAIYFIGQRKAFCRQIIQNSSCSRKETVDLDMLLKSRNDEQKVMQPIAITNAILRRTRKRNHSSQCKWTWLFPFINIFLKFLSNALHFAFGCLGNYEWQDLIPRIQFHLKSYVAVNVTEFLVTIRRCNLL